MVFFCWDDAGVRFVHFRTRATIHHLFSTVGAAPGDPMMLKPIQQTILLACLAPALLVRLTGHAGPMLAIKEFSKGDYGEVINGLTQDQRWMLIVLSGTGSFRIEGMAHPFASGSVFFLIGQANFRVSTGKLWSGFILYFDKVMMDYFLLQFPLYRGPGLLKEKVVLELSKVELTEVINRVFELKKVLGSGADLARLKLWFCLLMLDVFGDKLKVVGPVDLESRLLETFSALLETEFRKQRTSGFYAKQLGMTRRKLNSLCRLWFEGRGFAQVHRDRLMSEAEYLLLGTDKPIKEIAFELGFCSQQHFRAYFFKVKGVSPSKFRLSVVIV